MNISSNGNPYRQYVANYKAQQETAASKNDENESSSLEAVKDFACGMLGLDSEADDVREESAATSDGLFYNVGQVVKAAGSVASMISFFI